MHSMNHAALRWHRDATALHAETRSGNGCSLDELINERLDRRRSPVAHHRGDSLAPPCKQMVIQVVLESSLRSHWLGSTAFAAFDR